MEKPSKIIRRSIHTFLQEYHRFTVAALVSLPVSASILLSQSLPSSNPLFQTIHSRLLSMFQAAGFPPTSPFFSFLSLKLSQTLSSSAFALPFSLSLLFISKASVFRTLSRRPLSSPLHLFPPLFLTQTLNIFLLFAANSATLTVLFLDFNTFEALGFSSPNFLLFLSAAGAVLYSIVLANSIILCNLALTVSGMDNCGGFEAILRACVLMRGKAAVALSLTLPMNLALAAIEALFQYRVVRAYLVSDKRLSLFILEASLIAYVHSLVTVLDTVAGCMFYKSCNKHCPSVHWNNREDHQIIEIGLEEDGDALGKGKKMEEIHLDNRFKC